MPQLLLFGQPSVRRKSYVCMVLPDIAPESGVIECQDLLRFCPPGRHGAGALVSYLFLLALGMLVIQHILDFVFHYGLSYNAPRTVQVSPLQGALKIRKVVNNNW